MEEVEKAGDSFGELRTAVGLLGMIDLQENSYFVTCTSASLLGNIASEPIYRLDAFDIIPLRLGLAPVRPLPCKEAGCLIDGGVEQRRA